MTSFKDTDVKISIRKNTLDRFIQRMNTVSGIVQNAGIEGIDEVQDLVYSRAWAGCPVSSGSLRSSMYREQDIEDDTITARVGHGGTYNKLNPYTGKYTDQYALEVHESPRINRKFGATHKWLEKALNSVKPVYLGILAAYEANALVGGTDADVAHRVRKVFDDRHAQIEASRAKRKTKLDEIAKERRKAAGHDEESFEQWKKKRYEEYQRKKDQEREEMRKRNFRKD